MVLPWVKLGTLSLNASVSATVGGLCTYCIFGGENKEERQQIDAVYLQLSQIKKDFEVEEKELQAKEAKALEEAKAKVTSLRKVEGCLQRMDETYKKTMSDLGWRSPFKVVKYRGEYCKEESK